MKILISTFTYPPNKDGVALASAALADCLRKHGHTVQIATSKTGRRPASGMIGKIAVRSFSISNGVPLEPKSQEGERYLKFLQEGDFDLIINQNWNSWTTEQFLPIARKLRAKKILVSHGLTPHIFQSHSRPFWGIGQWLRGLRWIFAFLPRMLLAHDAFVFLSNHSDWGRFLDLKICRALFPRRTWIIPNTVTDLPLARKSKSLRSSFLGSRRLLAVYVANFCDRKDQLRAARMFANSGLRGSVLVLVGSEANDYSRQVCAWVRHQQARLELQGQRIVVRTGLSRKMAMEITASSDLVLLSAKSETQPLALIEAMALKKPWIAMNSGCIQTMEGGMAMQTESEFCQALNQAGTSAHLRHRLGKEGLYCFKSNHAPDIFSFHWQSLINRLFSSQTP